jgi:hypothetical protein
MTQRFTCEQTRASGDLNPARVLLINQSSHHLFVKEQLIKHLTLSKTQLVEYGGIRWYFLHCSSNLVKILISPMKSVRSLKNHNWLDSKTLASA